MTAALLAAAAAAGWCGWLLAGTGRVQVRPAGPGSAPGARLVVSIVRRVRRGPRQPVLELLSGLAAELATGQPMARALEHAAVDLRPDPCPKARHAAALGGDVAQALRLDGQARGAGALRGLAACWEVAESSGAGLALAVSRLAEGLRESEAVRAQLDGEVAAVRTSARLLAALPTFGLLIGQWIGAEPLAWLTGTWVGGVVFAAGILLEFLGLLWLRRMVAAVGDAT